MSEWTPEAVQAEAERRAAAEANGMCPDSGYSIEVCWAVELCDCAYAPPSRCETCGLRVWDTEDHAFRAHA
jgi:hypothetical protein